MPLESIENFIIEHEDRYAANKARAHLLKDSPLTVRERDALSFARLRLAELQGAEATADFVINRETARLWLEMIDHLAAKAGE